MHIRPLHGLVIVHRLREETAERLYPALLAQVAMAGVIRSSGWFIARVLALPFDAPVGLREGDKVLCEIHAAPEGAPNLPPEWFGLPEEETVCFIFCRRLPSPRGSEEIVERLRAIQDHRKAFKPDEFPKNHVYWTTAEGKARLIQLGSDEFWLKTLMLNRAGCGRDRLIKRGEKDGVLPEGILAILDREETEDGQGF